MRSCLEYSGAIWDTTIKDESDRLEVIQRRVASWTRGARGIISVTALLKDLKWQPLSDRRRNQRLELFDKILNNELNIPPETVNLNISKSRTICRTIPEWKSLDASVAQAGSFITFKSSLAPSAP